MTDSIDKKSDETRDNLKVDLDAMLDKAESSLRSKNETLDDEDAIDRLLMDTGFNVDDELERAALHMDTESSDDRHDELDDLLGFDNFSDDFKAPEVESGQVAKASFINPSDEEDELDLLLMNIDLDADDELVQSEADQDAEALQSFDDFSNINDPIAADTVSPSQTVLSAQAEEHLSPSNEDDELADFFSGGFNDSDLIQDEQAVVLAPATKISEVTTEPPPSSVKETVVLDEEDEFDDLLAGGFDELDLVEDDKTPVSNVAETGPVRPTTDDATEEFDPVADLVGEDFNETDLVQDSSQEVEASTPIETEQSDVMSNTDQTDEPDEGSDESDLIRDEEAPDALAFADEEQRPFEEQAGDIEQIKEPDNFSDFSDFNEPDVTSAAEEEIAGDQDNLSARTGDVDLDKVDQFADLFDDSGLIQETPTAVENGQESLSKPDEISQAKPADEAEQLDDFLNFNSFNASGSVEDNVVEFADDSFVPNEADEFVDLFSDGFDESDLIQDKETVASVPVTETSETTAESPSFSVTETVVPDEEDEFADLLSGGFDESDLVKDEETPPSGTVETGQAGTAADANHFSDLFEEEGDETDLAQSQEPASQASAADEPEMDEFADLFGEGFDEADLLQDQESEAVGLTMSDEQQKSVEPSELAENDEDGLFPEIESDAKDALLEDQETENSQDETDDFAALSDNFNDADLMQDDTNKALTDEESFSDLLTDEDGFDSLFTDVGFDAEETSEQASAKKDEFGDDSDLHDFFQLNENNSDSSESTGDAQLTNTDKSLNEEDDFLLPDFDITADSDMPDMDSAPEAKQDEFADAFGDSDFLNEVDAVQAFEPGATELRSINDDTIAESEPQQPAGPEVESPENVQLAQFAFEREDMQKQLDEAEKKTKKAKLFGYLALGFGGIALTAAAGLGFMAYNSKEEVAKLTATVSELQANLEKQVALPPQEEIKAMRNSVVQLNQQVNGFITELKGKPQFLVDLLNNKVPDIAAKQDMVSKALQVLQVKAGIERGEALETAPIDPVKIVAMPQPESVKEEQAPAKTEPAAKPAVKKDAEATKEVVIIKPKPFKNMDSAKPEANETTASAKAKVRPEEPDKPVVAPKVEVKEEPANVKRPEPVGKWGVNLVAFKQEWFAKSKAAEFARQGIFAEVIPVYEKNTTMYRLRVGGFKTKAEANANTARIKQTLNLDSVWVSDN